MESRELTFEIEEGLNLQVEISETWKEQSSVKEESPGFSNHSRDFGEAVQVIRPLVDKVLQPLKTLSQTPDTIELDFGFCFTRNSELLLKEGNKEAHIHVKLTFKDKG